MTTDSEHRTALAYERTVDRSLVHRHAVAEVYVTDAVRLGDDRFLVAAQLPRRHAYYTDGTGTRPGPDHILLLECVRQAATAAAHTWLDVPRDTSFLVTDWESTLTPAAPDPVAPNPAAPTRPGELRVLVTVTDAVRRAGVLRSASYRFDLELDGEHIGSGSVSAGYMARAAYRSYRELRAGGPPPSSDTLPSRRRGTPAPGHRVGRLDPANIVLVEAVWGGYEADARLDVPTDHPVFYDHPLDHVPAMSLLEAARQAALLAADLGGDARVVGLGARFSEFVELAAPVRVRARSDVRTGPERSVAVSFDQDGAQACAVTVRLARTPEGAE